VEAEPDSQVPTEMQSAIEQSERPAASTVAGAGEAGLLYARMVQGVNSWGRGLLLLGAVQVVASGFLSAGWGILVILVGLASFYFKDAAMFLVYALTIAWAAIQNLLAGNIVWIGFAILQFWWAYGLLRDFHRYRSVQARYLAELESGASTGTAPPMRAARVFPWASLALGVFTLVAAAGLFLWIVLLVPEGEPPQVLFLLLELMPSLAGVGLAMGMGAFLCGYRFKLAAALGMLGCTLVMLGWLVLMLL